MSGFAFQSLGVFVHVFDEMLEYDVACGGLVNLELDAFFIVPFNAAFHDGSVQQGDDHGRAVVHLLDVVVILCMSLIWRRRLFSILFCIFFQFFQIGFNEFSVHTQDSLRRIFKFLISKILTDLKLVVNLYCFRRFLAQSGMIRCRFRATARELEGTESVIVEPAAMKELSSRVTGATSSVPDPTKTLSPM